MEMKLPEAWSPLANTIPAFKEVHRNVLHKETEYHGREFAGHYPFVNTAVLEHHHRHSAFPARLTLPCRSCFVQLALWAQTGTRIRWQCFLTTEASQLSVGISEEAAWCKIFQAKSSVQFLISDKSLMKSVLPFVRRFSTPALFHMTILISCSAKHPPRTVLESVYLGEHRL